MTQPSRPRYQKQGPDWTSCTCFATAMAIDKATLGLKQPTGRSIRVATGDKVGGTTLAQNAAVARSFGVHVDVFTGNIAARASYLEDELRKGRGAVVQGNTSAYLNTKFRSTVGPVNHAIYVNEIRDDEALVYDPAADGRRSGIDQGPSWWPWSLVLKFAAALRPWGDNDPRTLGKGKVYCAIFPDTEPHAHLKFGGVKTTPFPDRTRIVAPKGRRVRVHSFPATSDKSVVETLPDDELFVAYQKTLTGEAFRKSRVWYGDHDGARWIHESRLSHEGGGT